MLTHSHQSRTYSTGSLRCCSQLHTLGHHRSLRPHSCPATCTNDRHCTHANHGFSCNPLNGVGMAAAPVANSCVCNLRYSSSTSSMCQSAGHSQCRGTATSWPTVNVLSNSHSVKGRLAVEGGQLPLQPRGYVWRCKVVGVNRCTRPYLQNRG